MFFSLIEVARMTMVARENDKPYYKISPLIPTTPEEILLLQEANGKKHKQHL
jgi:hypothetical protein